MTLVIILALIVSILASCDTNGTNETKDVTPEAQEPSDEESTEPATEGQETSIKEQNTASEEISEINTTSQETHVEEIDPGNALVSGTYFRENEQWPYDAFTISLNADGTYSYYETMISSHIGEGQYTVEGNIITVVDENIPHYDDEENIFVFKTYIFKFEYRDGTLVFLASESDKFIYTTLPDGAEFSRVPEE